MISSLLPSQHWAWRGASCDPKPLASPITGPVPQVGSMAPIFSKYNNTAGMWRVVPLGLSRAHAPHLFKEMTMKALVLTAALTCTAGTASALCEDAWYLRNIAFDRAGYCFGSALGKSVFSAECSTKSPSLNDWDQRMVSAHKQLEASYSCKIDTKGRHLASSLIGKLDDVDLLPTLSQFESSCVGYTGAPVTLSLPDERM